MTELRDDFVGIGRRIRERREALGLTPQKVNRRGGPSVMTLREMERGSPRRRRKLDTTFTLEQILGWSPGSIDAYLNTGREPIVVREPDPVGDDLSGFTTQQLEAELARRRSRDTPAR